MHLLCGWGCKWVPVRGSLCLFWCETHTKGLRTRSPMRPEEDKGRKVPERKVPENRTEQGSRQNKAVDRSQGKPTARMCEPRGRVAQSERMSQRSGWLCGNFAQIHARDSSQNARKVSQTSPFLRLELTQVRDVCSLFFHPLRCVCWVWGSVK